MAHRKCHVPTRPSTEDGGTRTAAPSLVLRHPRDGFLSSELSSQEKGFGLCVHEDPRAPHSHQGNAGFLALSKQPARRRGQPPFLSVPPSYRSSPREGSFVLLVRLGYGGWLPPPGGVGQSHSTAPQAPLLLRIFLLKFQSSLNTGSRRNLRLKLQNQFFYLNKFMWVHLVIPLEHVGASWPHLGALAKILKPRKEPFDFLFVSDALQQFLSLGPVDLWGQTPLCCRGPAGDPRGLPSCDNLFGHR